MKIDIEDRFLSEAQRYSGDMITDEQLIKTAYNALYSVKYIYHEYPTVGNGKAIGERVFCFEFYHVLKTLLFQFSDLDVTGEPRKGAGVVPSFNTTLFPDLVIHKYGVSTLNKIAFEVKIARDTSGKSILKDLKKLKCYLDDLHYSFAIFVCCNFDFIEKTRQSKHRHGIRQIINANEKIIVWNVMVNQNSIIQDIKVISFSNFNDLLNH